jgi:hypothetical protein
MSYFPKSQSQRDHNSVVDYMRDRSDPERSPSSVFARIFFLDVKVVNIVYTILVKLVPARSGVCGFEVTQRAKFFSFSIEENLLCIMRGKEF